MEILRQQIDERKFEPDHAIPSERILCRTYKISRITVRQAISEMMNEGILYRKPGKGTFVAKKKVNQGLVRFVNFSKTVLDLGMKPATKILENEIIPSDIQLARTLDIPATGQVLKLSLLGKGDEEPLVFYESYFPVALGRRMAREAVKREREGIPFSTYDLYGESSGISFGRVTQTLEAVIADDTITTLMHVRRGSALLMVTSIFFAPDQRPLEFRKAMYRGDRYKFHITRELS
jgi:GntR family transcriptional regulator